MKKILLTISIASMCLAIFAKHDGWYCSEVSDKHVTPHLDWNTKAKPLKVLFIISYEAARDVAELAQRMPLDYTVMITRAPHVLGDYNVYEAAMSGNSNAEKSSEFREKSSKKYDLIVCANYPLDIFPQDAVFQILQQFSEGTGLIVTGRKLPFKKLYEKKVSCPELFTQTTMPGSWNQNNIQAYEFEKGRLVQCAWPDFPNKGMIFPALETNAMWRSNYENHLQAFMTTMNWAAKRSNPLDSSITLENRSLKVMTKITGLNYRLRDTSNQIQAQGVVKNGIIPLPSLPNGEYYCDLLADNGFASHRFSLTSPLGKISIELKQDSILDFKPISGKIILEKPAGSALTVCLELLDCPYRRIWTRKQISVEPGVKEIDFQISNYYMPTTAGYVRSTFSDSTGAIGQTEQLLFFPDYKRPDYFQYTWSAGTNPNYASQLVDGLGFSGALSFPGAARDVSMHNVRTVSYFTRIAVGCSPKTGGVTLQYFQYLPETWAELKKLGEDDLNINRSEVQILLKKDIAQKMKLFQLARYGVMLYSLGDENVLNLDSGCGPSDLKSFRDFLKQKYGSIESLNREWKGSFGNFDEVPHSSPVKALADKNYPAWNDHLEYMEKMFSDIHALYASEIKKHDPRACVGIEGTFGGHDMESMMNSLDWWGPYSNMVENEVVRSLFPNAFRSLWCGYHGERGPDKFPVVSDHLLKGTANGNAWFAAHFESHSILAVDYTPAYPAPFMNELQRLRFGLAQLLINNPLEDQGIRIYWSHLARRQVNTDPRLVTPESGITALLRYFYLTGLSGEFVTKNTLDRLNTGKILFLQGIAVLSDKEADAICQFVKNGGTVIADMHPGVMNEFMRHRTQSVLSDLFGEIKLKKPEVTSFMYNGMNFQKVLAVPDAKFLSVRKIGKGKAILLNFNLGLLETSGGRDAYIKLMNDLVSPVGIKPFCRFEGNGDFRVRNGNGFKLLAFRAPDIDVKEKKTVKIILPENAEVYECGQGYIGNTSQIQVKLDGTSLRLFAIFPEKQKAPSVQLPDSIAAGEKLRFDFSDLPSGRTILIRVFSPSGKEIFGRNVVFDTAKTKVYEYPLEFNADKGTYRFVSEDVTTGLKKENKVVVK